VSGASARRKEFLRRLFHELPPPSSENANIILHESTRELWFSTGEASTEEIVQKWAHLSRHEIACDVAARVLAPGLGVSADYVHQLLPRLRRRASRINRALAAQN